MKLAFALYHYFPYGGLQRDFLRVARIAAERGHDVTVYCGQWQGERPSGLNIQPLPYRAISNHGRARCFARAWQKVLATTDVDATLGFNRMPGLDFYFASDNCFAEHLAGKPALTRYLPRYRYYLELEEAVFGAQSNTTALFLNRDQARSYQRFYDLPEHRYRVLPPGIERDRRRGDNWQQQREAIRDEFGVSASQSLILFLGSGFRVKGLDRALLALASATAGAAPAPRLLVVGDDNAAPYQSLARRLDVEDQVIFAGPRHDVPALLQGADLLLHPAYRESAGMVLLEATVAGLPVLTTDTCGYADYVLDAGSGKVVGSPFSQEELNTELTAMLAQLPGPWSEAGLAYGRQADIYGLHERVVDLLEARGER